MKASTPSFPGRSERDITRAGRTFCPDRSVNRSAVKAYGRIDKFMGDGIMAVFGDAIPQGSSPAETAAAACDAAVLAAIRMLEQFTELELKWREDWIEPFLRERDEGIELLLGIGVSYGPASFSFISTTASRHYTPIGSYINLAQRLEQTAGSPQDRKLRGSILVTATVKRHVGNKLSDRTNLNWKPGQMLRPKGIPYPLQTYWVIPRGVNADEEEA